MARARRSRHVSGLTTLEPWLQAFTLVAISLSLLQWRKSWTFRLADLLAGSIALTLHFIEMPLLASCLAMAYSVWMYTPGTFQALDLPSHASFMRSLKILEPRAAEDEEDCGICWSAETPLAEVKCGHRYCTSCLQAMGDHLHTTCPQCVRPLFSTYDRPVFILSKASVCCASINAALFLVQATLEVKQPHYFGLVVSLGSISAMAWYLWHVRGLIRLYGENWWRGAPGTETRVTGNRAPQMAFAAFVSGLGLFALNFVATDGMLS
ncbi:hypothetical protein M409DRAFT_57044 [Zasmidium cellare ATCC 36951]|uniref:RING-type domain-containing protein n=1 Tax=Zasmidium cellare ATCC 36951 TaxID=1080233 RepID=A0A6A6C9R9_ZASCE|nr:uncharacterized protein M409DRAFT_57044 [Zasmidium cellare ATCC 36951]KAF2163937.1 hypothetical protein M409DRAFT_57044 [Zasmidium cellare ATCC 36951]